MLVFSEYFAYVLNGWFPSEKLMRGKVKNTSFLKRQRKRVQKLLTQKLCKKGINQLDKKRIPF